MAGGTKAENAGEGNPGTMAAGRITHLGQQVAWVWQEIPVPVIAAVHGHARLLAAVDHEAERLAAGQHGVGPQGLLQAQRLLDVLLVVRDENTLELVDLEARGPCHHVAPFLTV